MYWFIAVENACQGSCSSQNTTSFLPSQPFKAWIHNGEVAGLWHFPDYSYTFKMKRAISSLNKLPASGKSFWMGNSTS